MTNPPSTPPAQPWPPAQQYPPGQPWPPAQQYPPGQPWPQGQPYPPPPVQPHPVVPAQRAAPGVPPPPVPPTKKANWRHYLGAFGITVVIVVVIGVFADGASTAEVGDCASVTGSATDADFHVVECTAADAGFRVGKVLRGNEQCPTPEYTVYTETKEGRDVPEISVCVVPRLVEGACYDALDMKTACPGGVYKVAKVVDGTADPTLCDATTTLPITFPEPRVTFCLSQPSS